VLEKKGAVAFFYSDFKFGSRGIGSRNKRTKYARQ
jgi:hypothetical protein